MSSRAEKAIGLKGLKYESRTRSQIISHYPLKWNPKGSQLIVEVGPRLSEEELSKQTL